MKTALILMLLTLSLTCSARASGPTTIEITTTTAGVTYTLHDYDMRVGKNNISPDEVEAWIRKYHPDRLDEMVIVVPDDRTAFKTVAEMLRRVKAAGVKHYCVTTVDRGEDQRIHVIGQTEKIWIRK